MNLPIIEVNIENFSNEVIEESNDKSVLVFFHATWCHFCQDLSPRLEKLSCDYDLVFTKVDVEQNPELVQEFGVEAFPDVRLIENGEVTDAFLGALPDPLIIDFFFRNELQPNNLLLSGENDDIVLGGTENDQLDGGSGNDELSGLEGNDQLYGNSGNDTLLGGDGDDLLIGHSGNDSLLGGDGDDLLVGVDRFAQNPGQGEIDIITGGVGKDRFVLGTNNQVFYNDRPLANPDTDGYARITDFTSDQDVIWLAQGFNYSLGSSPIDSLSGTGIFVENQSGTNELIGVVQDVEPQSLALDNSSQFIYY
ncbi:MAG: thioredoxin domain-containing protein [Xenococcus sp. MO_188.B8]|nr:thioredoxin domain-containing protein [Xenococcus sp. MO_188.B8]